MKLILNVGIDHLRLCVQLRLWLPVEKMKNPFSKKNNCIQCEAKFSNHEDLVVHVRHEHHKTIVKCQKCGREFIHEKDRLHHARKEHEDEMRERSNRKSYPNEYKTQNRIDKFRERFSDKL